MLHRCHNADLHDPNGSQSSLELELGARSNDCCSSMPVQRASPSMLRGEEQNASPARTSSMRLPDGSLRMLKRGRDDITSQTSQCDVERGQSK